MAIGRGNMGKQLFGTPKKPVSKKQAVTRPRRSRRPKRVK